MLQAETIAVFLLSLVLLVLQSVCRGSRDNNASEYTSDTMTKLHSGELW